MDYQLKDLLEAIGPPASLIFAAWIFMTILQSRYQAAFDRYRSLISSYRDGDLAEARHGNVKDQILIYKKRCEIMKTAANVGIVSAIFLICVLIFAALNVVFGDVPVLKLMSTICAFIGLPLVILAAIMVMRENILVQNAIDSEIQDIPDLIEHTPVGRK